MLYTKDRPESDWEQIEEAIIKGELPPWFEAESEEK